MSTSHAIGSGLVTAMFWFPITYYAMRKQFKLKPLTKLWRPFGGCVVLFAILQLLFGQARIDTSANAIMFYMLSVIVSASVLYWTSREQLSKPLIQQGEDTLVAEEPSVAPFVAQGTAQLTIVIAPKEIIAFRFLLMVCVIGLLTLLLSGTSYLMAEWKQHKLSSIVLLEIEPCINKVMKNTHDCQVPFPETNGTCSSLIAICNNNYQFDRLVMERDGWNECAENLLHAAPWFFILPLLMFYGIRWAITGRLKPLWLLRR